MNRLWAAILLLIIIVAITVCGVICVRSSSESMQVLLDSAEKSAKSGDLFSAAQTCHIAEKEWESHEKVLRIFVNTAEISEIGLTLTQLAPFAENDESAELIAQINVARIQIIHMGNMEAIAN